MGRFDTALHHMKRLRQSWLRPLLPLLVILLAAYTCNAVDIVASGENFRYPEYKKDGKPQFMVYGKKGNVEGVEGRIQGVLIDVFNKKLKDINDVRNYMTLELYPINCDYNKVIDFWKDKMYSDCFLSTPKADFDRVTKIVKGNEKVHFRSKAMDVDGVGFDADCNTRIIHIRSKVRVVIRAAMAKKQYPDESEAKEKSQSSQQKDKEKNKQQKEAIKK